MLTLLFVLALCVYGTTVRGAHAYDTVRRVQFSLRGTHGPYYAELYPQGSSMPIRSVSNINPYGVMYVTFPYASTGIQYRIKVGDSYSRSVWSNWFYLSPNRPGWYDSVQYIGEINMN